MSSSSRARGEHGEGESADVLRFLGMVLVAWLATACAFVEARRVDTEVATNAALLQFIVDAPRESDVTNVAPAPELDERLRRAQAAYLELYARDRAAIADIAVCIAELPASGDKLVGVVPQHRSPILILAAEPRVVLCYLLESIYRGRLDPWQNPVLTLAADAFDVEIDVTPAVEHYLRWSKSVAGQPIDVVRAGPAPLTDSDSSWWGGLRPLSASPVAAPPKR